MDRTTKQIKDVSLIEKELCQTPSGILAFYSEDEKVIQEAINFLYKDKNIFIFFAEDDEIYENIKLDSFVSFTTIRNQAAGSGKKKLPQSGYYLFSVTINGIIKLVEDKKIVGMLQSEYSKKYHPTSNQEYIDFAPIQKILYIDSEEIQAFEETGN